MLPIIFRGHEQAGFFAHALSWGNARSPLIVLPGNQRTQEARYACIIVVRDYFRMTAAYRSTGAWHYSTLETEILGDVREGRAILVFDLCNEGPAYDSAMFADLYAWIERNELPYGRCIWLCQNRLMGSAAAAALGSRASLIQFAHYDYFVKLMAWKFSPAEVNGFLGDRKTDYLRNFLNVGIKDKLLLCLNATPRLVRVLAIAALHHHCLMQRSLVSFPGMTYLKSGASLAEVIAFLERNPSLDHLRPFLQTVGHMSALRVDAFAERGNELVEKIDPSVYERTFFSIVTESDFDEQGIARVTEKTVKAFCMGHPALVLGNPRSVEIMRDLGFQDWSAVLDRNFDSTPAASTRFELVFAEVMRLVRTIEANPGSWLEGIREVSIRNHRFAVSGEFLARYTQTFDRPLISCMANMVAP